MATDLLISKKPAGGPAMDQRELYARGLHYVETLASRIWTDYNVHDPGITTLELLCYALTDLAYRASYPMEDLLASETDNKAGMKKQFFTARQILPNRALTLLDYRKLLIDLQGVKNAWVRPADLEFFADTLKGRLLKENPRGPGIREVHLQGLYRVLIDYMDDVTTDESKEAVLESAKATLHANRNLCEDFVAFDAVDTQPFILCAEMELEPDADIALVKAEVLFQVEQYLAPPVNNYTLSEMLQRHKPDGDLYSVSEIFDGPTLECGFIDDFELTNADLPDELLLSDVISIIMDIEGVRAVRDIVLNPEPAEGEDPTPLPNKWIVPVESGKKPLLNKTLSRLVLYKRGMPVVPDSTKVQDYIDGFEADARAKTETPLVDDNDIEIPEGEFRDPSRYYSFQNHFPAVYGIGESGLRTTVGPERQVLARQLKGYLLFFDQLMADYLSQLAHVKDLFSTDETLQETYFYQAVNSFADFDKIYGVPPADVPETIRTNVEEPDPSLQRRNRFLDHLISRFAERFNEYVSVMQPTFGTDTSAVIEVKARFLQRYPAISSERSLAYNYSLSDSEFLWDTTNTSGLERRLASLLGLRDETRRNLSEISTDDFEEGLYLIENILLRPEGDDTLFLPICVDPSCTDCQDDDPYSYRLHIILPAYAGRFRNMDFRRFTEEVIREETPAHILPKICWISKEDMVQLEKPYRDWIELKAGASTSDRELKLDAFIKALYAVKNVYPSNRLSECDAVESQDKFILGQTALGSIVREE